MKNEKFLPPPQPHYCDVKIFIQLQFLTFINDLPTTTFHIMFYTLFILNHSTLRSRTNSSLVSLSSMFIVFLTYITSFSSFV